MKVVAVAAAVSVAWFLQGCGGSDCPTPAPTPAPACPPPAPAPARWAVPQNAVMQYHFVTTAQFNATTNDTNKFTKTSNPECNIDLGNIDDQGNWSLYNYIGSKVPDSCCNVNNPGGPAEVLVDSSGNQGTCYMHDANFPNWPGNAEGSGNVTVMRLYLGCEDGELVGAENCVPEDTTFYTVETYNARTFTYPMEKAVADTKWENNTADGCHCSKRSRFNNGPGCYLAYATAFDYGQKFGGAEDTGNRGIVTVRIAGDCPAMNHQGEVETLV